MLKQVILAVGAAGLLSGCATQMPPSRTWVAVHQRDSFTDEVSCRVSPPDLPISVFAPVQFVYYPFVERKGVQVRLGLIAGGRFKIPVGRIRLRVDGEPAWTIETSETPLDMMGPAYALPSATTAGQPAAVKEAVAEASRSITTTMSQAMSPFTATTGEKAGKILQQMRSGHEIIYETLGLNQPASRTGEQPLGPDFTAALAECGL